jgi:acetyl-CoA synthetase
MDLKKVYKVDQKWSENAHINSSSYEILYKKSIDDPEAFWSEQAQILDWIEPYSTVKATSFNEPIKIEWFKDGKLNITENCLDRHLKNRGDQIAYIWEPEDPQAKWR